MRQMREQAPFLGSVEFARPRCTHQHAEQHTAQGHRKRLSVATQRTLQILEVGLGQIGAQTHTGRIIHAQAFGKITYTGLTQPAVVAARVFVDRDGRRTCVAHDLALGAIRSTRTLVM